MVREPRGRKEDAFAGSAVWSDDQGRRRERATLAAASRPRPEKHPWQTEEDHAAEVAAWKRLQEEAAEVREEMAARGEIDPDEEKIN